ncbi:hypothetical protein AB835_07685 [Candidatus Endobugula sertula]|uniref:YcaO domain-containing protein n=1 Tax=Candidatus Endobugula sertula TaxID=62101 RepID=A0A1D2QPZ9_9GAMM|nr:hypothetical protein AB835_07685 [Candidatus Endobugula sertula]
MPDYDKLLMGENSNVEYHLAGYGFYQEEAFIRLIGETAERYALVSSSHIVRNNFISASYNELTGQANVLPWELINIFSTSDYERLAKAKTRYEPLSKDDKISWLWCPSLFQPGEKIAIPVQFLYVGLSLQEKWFVTGISKGTAAHRTVKQALKAALIEAIEADAYMLRWYADLPTRKVEIDDDILQSICRELAGGLDLEPLFEELSMPDLPGHVLSAVLQNKKGGLPTIINGLSAGFEPKRVCYRAYVEALAIHPLARRGLLYMPEECTGCDDRAFHTNLDSNVMYWASCKDADKKLSFIQGRHANEVKLSQLPDDSTTTDEELEALIKGLSKISEFAVAFEITPVELAHSGWHIIRAFIPELMQLSLPSFPYSQHPRLLKYGGVAHNMPHTVP